VSNLVLWSESGYFDTSAATKILLHLWSLGIEEQFYFFWPILLFLARKKRIALLLAVVMAGSFALNMALLPGHPVATFYNPVTRFWELLVGSALAYAMLHEPAWLQQARTRWRHLLSIVGAVLVVVAIRKFDADQPFPGWRAVLPTVGAALLIAAGPEALVNKYALAQRPMVWVGLISFPLYLWHWPLLTFARIVEAATPAPKIRLAAVALSFVLSWAVYRFVETPIRHGKEGRRTVSALLGAVGALLALGLVIYGSRGFAAARGPWNVANISDAYGPEDQYTEACRAAEGARFEPGFRVDLDFCHSTRPVGAPGTKPDVVVVGDSHAGRVYSGLRAATDLAVIDLGRGSCLPFIGYEATNPGSELLFQCSPTMERLFERAIELSPRAIVVSGFFARPYDGRVTPRAKEPLAALARTTLERVAARVPKVVVVLDVPELPFDPSYCVDRPYSRGSGRGQCPHDRREADKTRALYEPDLRKAAEGLPNVVIFDPSTVLCDETSCFGVKDQTLLYDDRHHVSRYGAALIARALDPILR